MATKPKTSGQRIKSVYFAELENEGVRELAARNGTSVSMVVRIAVRRLLGLRTPTLEGEQELAESRD